MASEIDPSELTEPADSAGDPMAKLRPAEPAGMPLARARVLGALFGEHGSGGTFGRFRVLDRLGAGGMGVVYEAYDPDLARGVALKLVDVAATDRDTALAEAKALARLSHPNVVPIYDVGIVRDHVYLVMELVRGKTLRDWPAQRAASEILAVYQQAGAALAAAHRVGLVHRDFKPENAIVGADGRVRVVDFGLACEADDASAPHQPRGVAGTPRFMAPEVKAGGAATPAVDQYSFCVALAEALAEAREPPPRRIAVVVERGRAEAAADRYPSMHELLHALARDPARTRRRVAVVVGVAAAAAAGAFVLGRQSPGAADVCDDGAAQLAAAWPPATRAAALDRLAMLGASGRSLAALVTRALDAHDQRWVREYHAACIDRRRGTESDALVDRRTTCLRRGSDALTAVGELIEHAEADRLAELPRAVQSMPDPAACSDRDALITDIAPPPPAVAARVAQVQRQVNQTLIHLGAGRYEQALREAGTAVALARELDYRPTLAEALLVQGQARTQLAERAAAVPILTEAARVAIAAHADAVAVEAWARRVYAQGTTTSEYGMIGSLDLELIEALAQRSSVKFARALLYNNLGNLALAGDRRADAHRYFERALAQAHRLAQPIALELVVVRANLGIVTDDRGRGDALVAEAVAELSDRLGEDHPDTLMVRRIQGEVTTDDLGRAAERLTAVCQAQQADASIVDRAADCWIEVGLLRADLDDRDRAIEAMRRAARARIDDQEPAAYVSLQRGDAHDAARRFAAAIAANPPEPNDHWWDRLVQARLALGLGRARRALGDLRGARGALEAAIAVLVPIVRDHPAAIHERRLGRAQVELAFTLSATGATAAERQAAVDAGLAWLEKVGGPASERERLRRIR